jgi:hypothetical protein
MNTVMPIVTVLLSLTSSFTPIFFIEFLYKQLFFFIYFPYSYRLEVSQQPIRARMCGFGDKDRRPIDPPPVVRLLVSTADGTPVPER